MTIYAVGSSLIVAPDEKPGIPDLGFRSLSPEELRRLQGFSDVRTVAVEPVQSVRHMAPLTWLQQAH